MQDRCSAVAAIAVALACLWSADVAALMGEGGVGISSEPDSIAELSGTAPYCPPWTLDYGDRFYSYDIWNLGVRWIDKDIDLLIDNQFGVNPPVNAVTTGEANTLLEALDLQHSNRFEQPFTDLAIAYQYFAKAAAYDSLGVERRFSLFPVCTDTARQKQTGHIDVYLSPAKYDNEPDSLLIGYGATSPAPWVDDEEDPGSPEWHHNSLSVTDNYGNRGSDETLWPKVAAAGAVHEFTHLCWASNSWSHGSHWLFYEPVAYNELLACASEYMAVPPDTNLGGDLRYIYSVLDDAGSDSTCWDPSRMRQHVKPHDQRYHLWRLFGAYLAYQFDAPDSLQNSLIARWAQNVTDWGNDDVGMERTFCGLARILDDDEEYEDLLGHETGAERMSQLFANYGVARWVDYPILPSGSPQVYDFGADFSPHYSAGQFDKHDNSYLYGQNALWEYVMPPEFVLDGDNIDTWTAYPDTTDTLCPDEWLDRLHWHDPVTTGIWHGCVPIQVDLWGSNYLVFRADTLAFGLSAVDTLVVEFDWVDAGGDTLLNPRVELWLSVLRYKSSVPNLFLKPNRMRLPVDTQLYHRSVGGATVRVPAFKRNQNEAVVVVLTLVPRGYDDGPGSTSSCMSRAPLSGEPCVDLHYSYRFRVMEGDPEPPGGGCPFVSSLGRTGYTPDNNVLAPAWAGGDDVVDSYLMQQRPEASDGAYRLRLSEAEEEQSRFDRLQLLAVDHDRDAEAAVFPDGTIGTYRVTGEPLACRDQDGSDVLSLVLASDGEAATVKASGWFDVVFASGGGTRDGGGIGEEGGPIQKVDPFGRGGRGDGGEGTLSFAQQCYRANQCVSILDMPGDVVPQDGLITLRLTAPTDYRLDRLFTVERSEEPLTVTQCGLTSAHYASQASSCISALTAEDGVYASLAKGDTIDLAFAVPKMAGEARDFVLISKGGEVSRGSESEDQQPEAGAATISPAVSPNPFNPSTTISFAVPDPGGRVAVSIYNMAGRLVRRLADTEMLSEPQTLTWDGRGEHGESLGSGVYFCRIEVPGQSEQKKLVLLK